MPSGRVHAATTVAMAAISPFVAMNYAPGHTTGEYFTLFAGILSGILLTPDLDLAENGTDGGSRLARVPGVGGFLSWIWFVSWYFYGKNVSHRSAISHWIGVSTIFLVIYQLLVFAVILSPFLILSQGFREWFFAFAWSPGTRHYFYLWFFGVFLANTLHILLDNIFSEVKRAIRFPMSELRTRFSRSSHD